MDPGTAAIIAAMITGACGIAAVIIAERRGYHKGAHDTAAEYRQMHEMAINRFASSLGQYIERPISGVGDDLEVRARAIVRIRDDYRRNLTSLSDALNSELDDLANLVAELRAGNRDVLPEIQRTLAVLKEMWPTKTITISVATQRILAELGLAEMPRQEAPPAQRPPPLTA
jgi:hypothetical protein